MYCIYFLWFCFGLYKAFPGSYVFGNPDVSADYSTFSDGYSSQYGGIGIDNDIVFYDGMPGDTLNGIVVFVSGKLRAPNVTP